MKQGNGEVQHIIKCLKLTLAEQGHMRNKAMVRYSIVIKCLKLTLAEQGHMRNKAMVRYSIVI